MIRCRFGWHAWEKWGPVTRHIMEQKVFMMSTPFTSTEPVRWEEYRQERVCKSCGRIERREVKA